MIQSKIWKKTILSITILSALFINPAAATVHAGGVTDASSAGLRQSIEKLLMKHRKNFKAMEIMALVMDPKTGRLVVEASSNRHAMNFQPKFSTYRFEPGGLMAPFVIATALEHSDTTDLYPDGIIDVGQSDGKRHPADEAHANGELSVTDVLTYASDLGIAKIAKAIDPEILHETLRAFGFGEQTADASAGSLKSANALEKNVVRITTALGYGVTVTPVQLLRAYGVFVNGGKRAVPSNGSKPSSAMQVIAPKVAAQIKTMLRENVKRGTGRLAYVAGIEVGGKTSMARVTTARRHPARYNAGFYGYAQDSNRTYAVGILVIDPKTRDGRESSFATPAIFGEVVAAMYDAGLFGDKKHGE